MSAAGIVTVHAKSAKESQRAQWFLKSLNPLRPWRVPGDLCVNEQKIV